jgi:uncharacterized protein (DUF488 family)
MTVFTIGYEGLDTPTFLSLLAKHGIETVVDIRELPLSRKRGFSKRSLADILNGVGVDYVHMVDLGCPKLVRERYKQDGSWKNYTTGFLRHLKGQAEAINVLSALAKGSKCALLCFEADHRFCHRSFVAEAVSHHGGAHIRHITLTDIKKVSAA